MQQYYLVGGAVRDLLLGRTPREKDIAFSGSVDRFIRSNPAARKAGLSFPVFILNGVEHAPLRAETIEEDLLLRDFTINALALSDKGILHAHPDAMSDLAANVLRPCSPDALSNDPVRVFRAARFAATYPELRLSQEAMRQMNGVSENEMLTTIAAEQVGKETLKAMAGECPGHFIRKLADTNCLRHWFAELEGANRIPAGPIPYHYTTVLEHTAQIMDAVSGDAVAVWMALCHDLGKVTTSSNMLPRHHGHDKRGEALAISLGQRLKLSNRFIHAGAVAARYHMTAAKYSSLRPSTRVDMLLQLNKKSMLPHFCRLVCADSGIDITRQANDDLERILAVSLPDEERNLGKLSGEKLRQRRCHALL